jgi:hypothetical protein
LLFFLTVVAAAANLRIAKDYFSCFVVVGQNFFYAESIFLMLFFYFVALQVSKEDERL